MVYLPGVDCEDLSSPLLTRQTNLNLDLQPAWPHKSIIHHVPPAERRNFVNIYLSLIGFLDKNETSASPVCHSDDENVVQLIHAVNLGEELVHHGVIHTAAIPGL